MDLHWTLKNIAANLLIRGVLPSKKEIQHRYCVGFGFDPFLRVMLLITVIYFSNPLRNDFLFFGKHIFIWELLNKPLIEIMNNI